jgi:hypothetical protein
MLLSDALSTYISKPLAGYIKRTIYWYARHSAYEALKGEKTLIEIDMCRKGWEDHINRRSEGIRLQTAVQEEEKKKHNTDAGKIKYGMKRSHEKYLQ